MQKSMAIVIALAAIFFGLPATAEPIGTGVFQGASNHKTSGAVTITKQGGQYVIELGSDFSFDGAPDPYVSLGTGKRPLEGGLGSVLASNNGAQRYTIDAAGLGGAKQVIIWCKKYAVPLGVAVIE